MNKKLGIAVVGVLCLSIAGILAWRSTTISSEISAGIDIPIESNTSTIQTPRTDVHPFDHELIPHKALYDIKMASSSSGSQIVNIRGSMFYEWKPSCEAWTTDHRFTLTYEYSDSPAMQITSDFSTWESKDGKTFNFSSRRSRDGEIYEELRGHAERLPDGTGLVTYSMPEDLSFDLPKGFVFPMQHTLDLMQVMHDLSGAAFLNKVMFDGSDTEGPIEVNAFLGKKVNVMASLPTNPSLDISLLNAPARDIRMAFFPVLDQDMSAADYEMNALFHENGVISDMFIDYHDFSITQKLVALEKLDVPLACGEE